MRNLPCYLNWQGAVDLTCRIGYCLDFGTWFGLSALSMAFGVQESRLPLHPVLTIDATLQGAVI